MAYSAPMHADFDLEADGSVRPRTHGGARAGAGRKPAGYQKPEEVVDYEKAKARHEAAKADLAELDYKIKSGEYVSRASVRQAVATVMAGFVQTMRSVSDNLERKGVSPDLCVQVDAVINDALADVGRDLQMLGGDD